MAPDEGLSSLGVMLGEATTLVKTGDLKMTFRVGQKVVCIDDDFVTQNPVGSLPPNLPKAGPVYIVRSFERARGVDFLRLKEVVNGACTIGIEPAWHPSRFRAVVEKKTDISVFTAMLTGSKVGADA